MEYTASYRHLDSLLNTGEMHPGCSIAGKINLEWFEFHSDCSFAINERGDAGAEHYFADTPEIIRQNSNFSYPVILPVARSCRKKAILLFHGLNERSWSKYIPWATALAMDIGRPVILFPIAYHMSRSPGSWKDPRLMKPLVTEQLSRSEKSGMLTIANIALSQRLSSHPERFFLSGYQAAHDIIRLTEIIKDGEHPLFEANASVDFFGYSIGVLLAQVLLLANPSDYYSRSKAFFFCGGAAFESLRGISKYIMDDGAFSALTRYYGSLTDDPVKCPTIFRDLFLQTYLGKAFHIMLSEKKMRRTRKKAFKRLQDRIFTVCLTRDQVAPAEAVKSAMQGTQIMEMDFPYRYTHENPFPYTGVKPESLVDRAFSDLFEEAGAWLSG